MYEYREGERLGASGACQPIHMYTTAGLTKRVPNVHSLKASPTTGPSTTERAEERNTQDNLKGQVKPIHLVQSLTALALDRTQLLLSSPPRVETTVHAVVRSLTVSFISPAGLQGKLPIAPSSLYPKTIRIDPQIPHHQK